MTENPTKTKRIMIIVSENLHMLMKQYAKRQRIKLGLAYDHATKFFLSQTHQYMGVKRERQLKKG